MTVEEAEDGTILKILAGSHIHGLDVETSDRDEEAIIIETISQAMGLENPFEELICESPEVDVKYVSLRKWCRLACKGNPNFLLPLFAPTSSILKCDARGSQLRDMAHLFVSKQAIKSHLGYMQGQRTRIVNHQQEFGRGGGRGQPRFALIEKYGYDTKFAMHLLRLGLQGVELLTHGYITLPMGEPAKHRLLEVRQGLVPLPDVLAWAEELEAEMKATYETCALPVEPDYAAIEAFMLKCYIRKWTCDRAQQDMMEDRSQ